MGLTQLVTQKPIEDMQSHKLVLAKEFLDGNLNPPEDLVVLNYCMLNIDSYERAKKIYIHLCEQALPQLRTRESPDIYTTFAFVLRSAGRRIQNQGGNLETNLDGVRGDFHFCVGLYDEDLYSNDTSGESALIFAKGNYRKAQEFYKRLKDDQTAQQFHKAIDLRLRNLP